MLDAQIDLILDDLKQGRKTIDDLVAQKKLYEGGNAWLTSLVSEDSEPSPIADAIAHLYGSICIVLHCLTVWFPHLFEDDAEVDVEEAA
jgi:hypothetical protein